MMMVFMHKIFSLWRFQSDNSFTRLILLDNLSQSMESNSYFLYPLILPTLGAFPLPVFLPSLLSFGKQISSPPFSWQSTFPCSLFVTVCLSVSPCNLFLLGSCF